MKSSMPPRPEKTVQLEQESDDPTFPPATREEADRLVVEFTPWAEGIARSVARAWNLDWREDGLDGAALEALVLTARRFQPARGVPFRGYARRRIHEAACDAARKSKGFRRGSSENTAHEIKARELSAQILNVFPELRHGEISISDDSSSDSEGMRGAIRQLLVGATLIATRDTEEGSSAEELMDKKRIVEHMSKLDLLHQALLWKVYWEGFSMRQLATEWGVDELTVIREHRALLGFLTKKFSLGRTTAPPKVRPGLKPVVGKLKKEWKGDESTDGPFAKLYGA